MSTGIAKNSLGEQTAHLKFAKACDLHQGSTPKDAIPLYLELWNSIKHERSGINAAAIFRQIKEPKKAIKTLREVVTYYPNSGPAWGNLGNNLFDSGDSQAAVGSYIRAIREGHQSTDLIASLVNALKASSMPNLALKLSLGAFYAGYTDVSINIIEIVADKGYSEEPELASWIDYVVDSITKNITKKGIMQVRKALAVASVLSSLNRLEKADRILTLAKYVVVEDQDIQKKYHMLNTYIWNLACSMLGNGELKKGWTYYDAGLLVPAQGKQKYQRSLFKPFPITKIPIWRGENVAGKNILILGEQGIGDTMMFTLILDEFIKRYRPKITFCPGDRLLSIYKRSFVSKEIKIVSSKEIMEEKPEEFHAQIPIGSLLKFLAPDMQKPYLRKPLLIANDLTSNKLQTRYKRSSKDRPLVGISWRGGAGKKSRVQVKSMELSKLLEKISDLPCDLISLQYGDCQKYVQNVTKKIGRPVIYDTTVNALKDMDRWLAQVSLCDFVVSVANTTVHGSGGLGIPTCCLVPKHHDWRWIKPSKGIKNSYWYSSVDAIIQDEPNSWDQELIAMRTWLLEHMAEYD